MPAPQQSLKQKRPGKAGAQWSTEILYHDDNGRQIKIGGKRRKVKSPTLAPVKFTGMGNDAHETGPERKGRPKAFFGIKARRPAC
jgi:hypothetical protein